MSSGAGNRGNALLVLALCFFGSALLRAGDVVAALPDRHRADAGPAATGAGAPAPDEPDAGTLVAELRQRRAALAEREAKLDERAQMLEMIEERLRDRLSELEAAQRKLEATAALVDDAAGKDVRHLVAMYEQMKPKQAGQIFNAMDPTFAAGFLGQMNAPSAALILANMDAEKAYSVSLLLAGRNVDRP
jgi:flagellar motility protein MotE (MotC chaperone)